MRKREQISHNDRTALILISMNVINLIVSCFRCKHDCRFCGSAKTSICCVIVSVFSQLFRKKYQTNKFIEIILQRGRQKPLIIFRDIDKGWILRAACEYSVFEHVGEYAGEVHFSFIIQMSSFKQKFVQVLYDPKPGASNSYDFELDVEAKHPDGKMKSLLVSALERVLL